MLQPRGLGATSSRPSASSLLSSFTRLAIGVNQSQTRAASHATQGRANKAAPGPGKRLGAKKSDSEPVVPGNIIFRQRGTLWFPGENCVMGRDHTISANAKGFVRFYRDPGRNPDKKYIGVVFEQHEQLPRGRNASRRRRLGMDAVPIQDPMITEGEEVAENVLLSETPEGVAKEIETTAPGTKPQLSLRQGFQYRESNWSIGRTAERRGISIPRYDRNDRFAAWRRRAKEQERAREFGNLKRSLKENKGNKKRQRGKR